MPRKWISVLLIAAMGIVHVGPAFAQQEATPPPATGT